MGYFCPKEELTFDCRMTKKQFTDSEFIEGIKNNEELVLSALYRRFYPLIRKYVLTNSGTEEEAQDIYQESIIVLFQNVQRPGFVLSCALQTYLYSVARRKWLKQLSRGTHVHKLNEEQEFIDVSTDLSLYEEKEIQLTKMQESLEEMGEPCKTLILDFYVQQLSMEDIADKFGYTNSDNAKNQKYKCLQRLKKLFFNE